MLQRTRPAMSTHATNAIVRRLLGLSLLGITAACTSPTRPSVSVVAARPLTPANDAQISFYAQPITLVVSRAASTVSSTVITFEVATDAAFANNVATKAATQDDQGTTTVSLGPLASSTAYYWRATTRSGDNTVVSSTFKFIVGPTVVLHPPVLDQPAANSLQHRRPTFTVQNALRVGAAGPVSYRFEVATDPSFEMISTAATVTESAGQTSFTPTMDLAAGVTHYWRVRTMDATTGMTSDYAMSSFSTPAPDDGNYRYDLVVEFPPACVTQRGFESVGKISFDDNLSVHGDMLRFAVPVGSFAVNIVRDGTHLSGTIGGMSQPYSSSGQTFEVWRTRVDVFPRPPLSEVPTFTGATDNKGRLTGTFDGAVQSYLSFETFACVAQGFTWTLTPHR